MNVYAAVASLLMGSTDIDQHSVAREAAAAFQSAEEERSTIKARQNYRKAASLFEQLRVQGSGSSALLQNQGNAFFLGQDVPNAILAYHRGLILAPENLELQDGLSAARQRVAGISSTQFSHGAFIQLESPRLQFTICLLCYAVMCLLGTLAYQLKSSRYMCSGICMFILTGASTIPVVQYEAQLIEWRRHPLVVIVEDDTVLRVGNGQSYAAVTEKHLNKGVEGKLHFAREGWVQLELANGLMGWVPRDRVLVDE